MTELVRRAYVFSISLLTRISMYMITAMDALLEIELLGGISDVSMACTDMNLLMN